MLEILVAFVLFALAFGGVLQILTSAMRNTTRAEEYTQAALWAQTLLDDVGVGETLESGSDRGEFNDEYSWELEIEPFEMEDGDGAMGRNTLELMELRLTVLWRSRGRERSANFATLRATIPEGGQ